MMSLMENELAKWLAVIIKAAGGSITIPYSLIEETDFHGTFIRYDHSSEGIQLTYKENWVIDACGDYSELEAINRND